MNGFVFPEGKDEVTNTNQLPASSKATPSRTFNTDKNLESIVNTTVDMLTGVDKLSPEETKRRIAIEIEGLNKDEMRNEAIYNMGTILAKYGDPGGAAMIAQASDTLTKIRHFKGLIQTDYKAYIRGRVLEQLGSSGQALTGIGQIATAAYNPETFKVRWADIGNQSVANAISQQSVYAQLLAAQQKQAGIPDGFIEIATLLLPFVKGKNRESLLDALGKIFLGMMPKEQ